VAQAVDAGKSTNLSSAATGDHEIDAKNAMKSTAPGYMSTGEIHGVTGRSSGITTTGRSGKKPASP
jgi:hypothetical protein